MPSARTASGTLLYPMVCLPPPVMMSNPDETSALMRLMTLHLGHTCLPDAGGQSSEAIAGTAGP